MEATYLTRRADEAFEAVRAINHATITSSHPAPVVFDVLGSLKLLGPALGQAFGQLGDGLGRSLDVYDVYQDDDIDPARVVARAIGLLGEAGKHARAMGFLLGEVQVVIARQGYHDGGVS